MPSPHVQPPSQPPPTMLMGPNSFHANNPMITPNSAPGIPAPSATTSSCSSAVRLPFGSLAPPPPQSQQQPPKPLDSFSAIGFDGSPSPSSLRFNMEPGKKKRGRPRKYTPDGSIALGLAPTTPLSSASGLHGDSYGANATAPGSGSAGGGIATSSETPAKRNRGRPPGSVKKQLDALGGTGGVGFTPHVITVKAGEDIASKIMAFSQQGPRTICILSANGAICNVTLRQPAMSGGTVTYEGRFEIISLSGSFLLSDDNGSRSRTGGLSVSLAGSDGRVLGGGVAGMLMAASPVQVIVGSFIAEGRKQKSNMVNSGPSSAPGHMLNFGAPVTGASPPSQGPSSESSDDDGSSPLNRGSGLYGNPGQPLHGMQMYQLWSTGQTQQ